jgi:hypothetical protein
VEFGIDLVHAGAKGGIEDFSRHNGSTNIAAFSHPLFSHGSRKFIQEIPDHSDAVFHQRKISVVRPRRHGMISQDVEFIAEKTKWGATSLKVLLLNSGDVVNGCHGVFGVDWSQSGQTLSMIRQANRYNGNGHYARIKAYQVGDAPFQIRAIIYAGHQDNLSVELDAAIN